MTNALRRHLGALVAVTSVVVTLVGFGRPVAADDDGPNPDEGSDVATPGLESQRQVLSGLDDVPQVATQAIVPWIDDFAYDDLLSVGWASEVCHGSLRSGTLGAYRALVDRFGGTPGTLYACRERYAVHERPECDGQQSVPGAAFFSDCWSNHAQGRAFDIMVGTTSGGYNQARGNAIVNFLLAPDAAGNVNANARRLGVQQILWNDRCWNSDGDRGISSAAAMRPCGYGHFDHIHVDLTVSGAEGSTSWWGQLPQRTPTPNGLWYRDTETGSLEWQTFVNLQRAAGGQASIPSRFATIVGGDWNGDGVRNEVFGWNRNTGEYGAFDASTGALQFSSRSSPVFDQFANGDFDGDGLDNDLILLDRETGAAEMWTFWSGWAAWRGSWRWRPGWDRLIALDGNSDGRIGETFLFDQDTGDWFVHSWDGITGMVLNSGWFQGIWDDIVAADFDAQGNADDLFMRDKQSGSWVMLAWSGSASATQAVSGAWLTSWDHFLPGDWNTDGRLNELYLRDDDSGFWTILSWRRFWANTAVPDTWWRQTWDTFVAGSFG
jgi:hypothetical protein